MIMKKILILFLLLVPLFTNAQTWYRAIATSSQQGNEQPGDFEDCDMSVFRKDHIVKLFAEHGSFIFRSVDGGFKTEIDNDGNVSQSSKCVDESGDYCELTFMYDKSNPFILLLIQHKNSTVCFIIVTDDV